MLGLFSLVGSIITSAASFRSPRFQVEPRLSAGGGASRGGEESPERMARALEILPVAGPIPPSSLHGLRSRSSAAEKSA